MLDPFREGEAPAEPVSWAARQEARAPDRNIAPEAAEGINHSPDAMARDEPPRVRLSLHSMVGHTPSFPHGIIIEDIYQHLIQL